MISLYPESPGCKATETSAQAACKVTAEARILREQCLAILKTADHTADEVAEELGQTVLSIRPRISELGARNFIYDSGVRRRNASGHSAIVWTVRQPTSQPQ